MGLKDMFGWTSPKDQYGNALGLAQGVTTASTATNAAHNGYSGYQNIANSATSASQAQQASLATLQQMALNHKYNAYMQAQAVKDEPPKVNLSKGAWSVPISQLIDLWVVKFGGKWVDHKDIVSDEFYQIACLRLEKTGKLETHYLQDRHMPVYRIVE